MLVIHFFARQLCLQRAVFRGLSGGRVDLTEHYFNSSVKLARKFGLVHDEGMVQLYMCDYLRQTLTSAATRQHLAQVTCDGITTLPWISY